MQEELDAVDPAVHRVALVKEIDATTISPVPTAHIWGSIVGGLPVSDNSISQTDVLNDWGRDGW